MKPSPRAFTLIELLLAVAIVATLAMLLLPAFRSATQAGQKAQTIANLRAIGAALHNYVAESDGRLPGPCTVAVFNTYLTGNHSPGATPAGLQQYLGAYLTQRPAPWAPPNSDFVHLPALDLPVLSPKVRQNYGTAQYVKLDYAPSSPDNRFGDSAGNMSDAAARTIQPKKLAALTDTARRSAILTTADQQSWQSSQNTLLPPTGAFAGKRLYLFLDGSVEGPLEKGPTIWQR